jgi:hypothetical protein
MKKSTINGKDFYDYIKSGANEVYGMKDDLNRINVFPVKDGDTGTNLVMTMNSIVDETEVSDDFDVMIRSMSNVAFESARGNSGIIFASFINGFSNACGQLKTLTMEEFSNGATVAVEEAYSAVSTPVEGTMLTVIKEWAEYIAENYKKHHYFSDLLEAAYSRAKIALDETPEKLEILRKNKVVDSGAKGFVLFLEGINNLVSELKQTIHEQPKTFTNESTFENSVDDSYHDQLTTFRYCTEIVLRNDIVEKPKLEALLGVFGDSMIVTGNGRLIKLHIHTDAPDQVTKMLIENNYVISKSKVDDMKIQNDVELNKLSEIAILTDSIADISMDLIEKEQIHVVSASLIADESVYLDKMTVTQDNIKAILDNSKKYPSSTQPDVKQIRAKMEWLLGHYKSVVVISVSKALSGTYGNFEKIVDEYASNGYDIKLVDSKLNTSGQGMVVLKAAEMANKGHSVEEIVSMVEDEIPRTDIYVSLDTFKYAVKGGRVPNKIGKVLMFLGAKPVMTLKRSGEGTAFGLAFSRKSIDKKIMRHVAKINSEFGIDRYTIVHSANPELAEQYANMCEEIIGKKPLYMTPISAVTTIHSGIGSVAISLVRGR